jgi:hypothetical protein
MEMEEAEHLQVHRFLLQEEADLLMLQEQELAEVEILVLGEPEQTIA